MSVEEDIYEMFKDKIDAAKSEGIKKGLLEKQKSVILTLSKKGYSAEEISTMLDIPLKEVETALSK
jgi:DNA-directed RNA polymerase specialized sigma24 family protein